MKKRFLAALLLALLLAPIAPARAALYALGDPVADFTLATVDGEELSLSGLLASHRAVLLNFWFINCPWCDYEFPYLQEAWEEWKDEVAVVAVTPYDTAESVRDYRDSRGFAFPMAVDSAGLSAAFGVAGYPTSVVIDRYGVCTFLESGAQPSADAFRGIFAIYGAESYEQSLVGFDAAAPIPTETMPPVEEVAVVLNEAGTNVRFEELTAYEWPWLVKTDSGRVYLASSNVFMDETTAWLRGAVTARAGEVLAFDYRVSSEYVGDYFVFYVNDEPTKVFSGETDWRTYAYRFAEDGDYRIAFAFEKDYSGRDGDDQARVDALRLLSGAEADAAIAACPAWPAALEGAACLLEVRQEGAREVLIDDPSGELDAEFRMDAFYIVPDGEVALRLLLGDACDPDAALLYDAMSQRVEHAGVCEDDGEGFLFSGTLGAMDAAGHLYGATRVYPFYGDYEDGLYSVMFFDSADSLEQFLRLALVNEEGEPRGDVTWVYADTMRTEEKDYSLLFVDRNDAPVAGVTVRISSESGAWEATTDANGSVTFRAAPAAYRVEVRGVPDGLRLGDLQELVFPEEGGEISVTLMPAQ